MVTFSHLDAGTAEATWQSAFKAQPSQALDTAVDSLIVVASHPDDESLGAAGLIHRVHRAGGAVSVIVASDGEASHPNSPSHAPAQLAAMRRAEVIAAVHALAPGTRVQFLGLPDGAIREHLGELEAAVRAVVSDACAREERCLIAAPWSGDGHRDHRVTAEAVAEIATAAGIPHVGYPIWFWHWGSPDGLPWALSLTLVLSEKEREAKSRALAAHASQVRPLSDAAGDEAIIPEAMQAYFSRGRELYVAEHPEHAQTMPAEWFERFYRRHADPWGFETRWYEQRKRALIVASLPKERLGDVFEIGSATGLVSLELADRADRVFGMDASAMAIDAARTRLHAKPHLTFEQGVVPRDWPAGKFDTIVLSEVGYYLSRGDLARTIALIDSAMTSDGCLVACHWRHPVAEYPLTGDEVHRALRSSENWRVLVVHEEEDFILEVFARPGAPSVAQMEGLS